MPGNPESLRLWTFHNPEDGPMALEVEGVTLSCEGVELSMVDPDPREIVPWSVPLTVEPTTWEVILTLKIKTVSQRDPRQVLWEVETVPNYTKL